MDNDMKRENDEFEIDLGEIFLILIKKWWLIAGISLIGLLIGLGITKLFIAPKYQSQAMLYILSTNSSDATSMLDLQIGAEITEDFEIIATSKAVIDISIKKIEKKEDVTLTREQIEQILTVETQDNTRILTIRAVSKNPEHAYWVAKAVSEATAERVAEITKSEPPAMVTEAEMPEEPIGPSMRTNAILGFFVGALIACAVLIIQFLVNDNIKTEEDVIKYLGEVTLASIPYIKSKDNEKEESKRKKGRKKQPQNNVKMRMSN